jgi:hypothetical protein
MRVKIQLRTSRNADEEFKRHAHDAAVLAAQADDSNPYAYNRALNDLRHGLLTISEMKEDALRTINARVAMVNAHRNATAEARRALVNKYFA